VSYTPPTQQLANTSLNEKAPTTSQYPSPAPPPAYAPPVLSIASALYAYTPTDAGDLALQPHDRIQVYEHMNNDCMTPYIAAERDFSADRFIQGGVVETSGPASRASSRGAT